MLTALTIKEETQSKWYKKLINKLKGNRITAQLKSARGVSIVHFTYINRTGKVDWGKINSLIGNQRNHLLCSENIILPSQIGFRRFDNKEYKARLASNMGMYILSQINTEKIKVALYDPKGEYGEAILHLVENAVNFIVVTDNPKAFQLELGQVYQHSGTVVQVTSNRAQLMDCAFVIAPGVIEESLPLAGDTIVLSGNSPSVCTSGMIYYNYSFKMPNQFDEIKPQELTEEYFCGALYTKCRQYELGSIVPTLCFNSNFTQTVPSICDYLKNMAKEEKVAKET